MVASAARGRVDIAPVRRARKQEIYRREERVQVRSNRSQAAGAGMVETQPLPDSDERRREDITSAAIMTSG